jgi:hypothetical protein
MHIVFHIGVHHTDEGLLLKALRSNADALATAGILIPQKEDYRSVLGDTLQKLRGEAASEELQDAVLDKILEEAEGDRVFFTNENFSCMHAAVFAQGRLYERLAKRSAWLRNIFPDFDVSIAMSLRDPATLVPEVYKSLKDAPAIEEWMNDLNLGALSWLQVVRELREALPATPLILWCNEDTPLIWPEVLQAVTGHPEDMTIKDQDILLAQIMSNAGLERMRSYLTSHPPRNVEQRRRVITAFLDKFAIPEAMEEEIDLEGWSEEIMDALSQQYEIEVDEIARMPGVQFILP